MICPTLITFGFCLLSQHFNIWSLGEKARQLRYLASALEAEWRHVPVHCRERYPSFGSVPALMMWPSSVSHTCLAGVPWDKRFERSVSDIGSQCSFGGSQINSLLSIEHTRCRQIHLVDSRNQFCIGLRVQKRGIVSLLLTRLRTMDSIPSSASSNQFCIGLRILRV